MIVKNTDPRFGVEGPFEIESFEALVAEMMPTLTQFAHNAWHALSASQADHDSDIGQKDAWIANKISELELDLIAALEVQEPNPDFKLPIEFRRGVPPEAEMEDSVDVIYHRDERVLR